MIFYGARDHDDRSHWLIDTLCLLVLFLNVIGWTVVFWLLTAR